MCQRFNATVVTLCMLFAASPARADHDPILGPPGSSGAKAKRVTVVAIFGASLVAWGASLIFLGQASSAMSDRRDLSRVNGGSGNLGAATARAARATSARTSPSFATTRKRPAAASTSRAPWGRD